MKKFIVAASILVFLLFLWNGLYYQLGIYLDLSPSTPVTTFTKTEGKTIYVEQNGAYAPFEIRGVDLGVGIPGKWATDYAIDKETYLHWFEEIQEMGANTIRVYTILHQDFYDAFYEYNQEREEPLYLLHGVWINDYMFNSHRDAYHDDLLQTLLQDCKTLVDILHGKKTLSLGRGLGSGSYRKDVSSWVLGYIIGVEWESSLVIYTNQNSENRNSFSGNYLYTTEDATPFEAMLCQVGEKIIEYESHRYKQQRLIAFSNWPTTDPFVYSPIVSSYRSKMACVDVEHIKSTENYLSGMFASYHVYPYFPDYLEIERESHVYTAQQVEERMSKMIQETLKYRLSLLNAPSIEEYLYDSDYYDNKGRYNTYLAYLRALNRYHTLPVVITEYGVTTGRGMAQRDVNTGRNQGHMTEQEQGQALIECYEDIMEAGCAGSCVFTWHDEWFKRTWNTMHAVDLDNTAYWSDYQTNEQFFGLLTFDPGKEETVCQVDGDLSEWVEEDIVTSSGDMELSMKFDEKFVYFMVKKDGFDPLKDVLYIPIDTTPKTGSTYCDEYNVAFERACDFLIVIHGRYNSRMVVQKRYEALSSTYGIEFYGDDPYVNTPDKDSPSFERIYLPLILAEILPDNNSMIPTGIKYETGALRYGNSDPNVQEFDSLSDFLFAENAVEIRIPWQLLNFSNPSEQKIHDDYFENYGVENLRIKEIYAGISSSDKTEYRIRMAPFLLDGWNKYPTSHERLKRSYYILKDYWTALDAEKSTSP